MAAWEKKRRVKKRYDLTAHMYDVRYSQEQASKIEAAMIHVSVSRQSVLLDVGCGTGLLFPHVAHNAKTVVGLDTSKGALLQAKKRTRQAHDVHLVLADADHMPFGNGVFSHVFAVTLLQNMPKPLETLKEIRRVAIDGAAIVVSGMKGALTSRRFAKLLCSSGLRADVFVSEDLKCHVAVCAKA